MIISGLAKKREVCGSFEVQGFPVTANAVNIS
jgi:hypothetical protein